MPGSARLPPRAGNEPDLAAYDRGVAAAARSDLAASVRLPDGGQVYLFGDTVAVNGQVICGPSACPHGYPHDSIAIQRPGTATFAMQSCAATGCPYGWQQVPDWPDGSYFWMAAPAVDGTSLYVIGERISQPDGAVQGEYTARFTVGAGDALTYQGITALTGPAGETQWGSATADPGGRGWWLTGTRNTGGTGGTGCVADCTTMDTAFVPSAALTRPSAWHVQPGVLPSGEGYDLGTVVSMSHVAGHGWVAYHQARRHHRQRPGAAQRLARHRALARRRPAVAGHARARMRMDLLGPGPPGQPGPGRPDARVLGQQPR